MKFPASEINILYPYILDRFFWHVKDILVKSDKNHIFYLWKGCRTFLRQTLS